MGINKRQSTILALFNKFRGPITAKWIAKELNVSDRTVRNEINNLRQECKSLGIEIEPIRGKGYNLKINDSTLFKEALKFIYKRWHINKLRKRKIKYT